MQCTVVPGTTRRLLVDPLNAAGRKVGEDIFVAFSPERINPGDPVFNVSNTTKLVAGATDACLDRGREFVASFVSTAMPVASLETGELAKLVENTFRFINISSSTKWPFCATDSGSTLERDPGRRQQAIRVHGSFPRPGIGGDCIPVSPRYLQAAAERKGLVSDVIAPRSEPPDECPGTWRIGWRLCSPSAAAS